MVPIRPARDPRHRVETIGALGEIFDELALRAVAAAAILIDHDIAVPHEMRGDLRAGERPGHADLDLTTGRDRLAVGRPLHDDRRRLVERNAVPCRTVDVGRKTYAVARPDHHLAMNDHAERDLLRRRQRLVGHAAPPSFR
jgi:hypothetical protein